MPLAPVLIREVPIPRFHPICWKFSVASTTLYWLSYRGVLICTEQSVRGNTCKSHGARVGYLKRLSNGVEVDRVLVTVTQNKYYNLLTLLHMVCIWQKLQGKGSELEMGWKVGGVRIETETMWQRLKKEGDERGKGVEDKEGGGGEKER